MKIKILLACLICALFANCMPTPIGDNSSVQDLGDYKVIEIQGCEYIIYDNGIGGNRVFAITHKGNCKNKIHTKVE